MSFGRMPIANGFLTREQFATEYFFDLQVGFCESCGMVQLTERVDRERLFNETYPFFTSTSSRMVKHFTEFADEIRTRHLTSSDPLVVEIGSNDGTLLSSFAKAGQRHLGIEPSSNVAEEARRRGVQTLCAFFDESLAKRIASEHGPADVLVGANVMCHIPDLHAVAKGARVLLKPEGVLVFEDPYLGEIVQKVSYDQIYDEHVFYFSLGSLSRLFEQYDLEVYDVRPLEEHGGSMRYYVGRKGRHAVSSAVEDLRAHERALGLHRRDTYETLRTRIERSRDALKDLLVRLRKEGKRIVGYGATSKSTTVTNYCGITPDLVEFVSDTTPIKQGKYTPGVHIPVRPHGEFSARYPDCALLFAWNHAGEIMAKEPQFRAAGGRWIVYVPQVQILS